jgi:Flp pilus assembly pilin Flp
LTALTKFTSLSGRGRFRGLLNREAGNALVEYVLILALISVVAIAVLSALGAGIASALGEASHSGPEEVVKVLEEVVVQL